MRNLKDLIQNKRANGDTSTPLAATAEAPEPPSRLELLRAELARAKVEFTTADDELEGALETIDAGEIVSGSIEHVSALRRTRDELRERVASLETEIPFAVKADEKRRSIAARTRRLEEAKAAERELGEFHARAEALARPLAALWQEYDAWATARPHLMPHIDFERVLRAPEGGLLNLLRNIAEQVRTLDGHREWLGEHATTTERREVDARRAGPRQRLSFATIDGESTRGPQPVVGPELAAPKSSWRR